MSTAPQQEQDVPEVINSCKDPAITAAAFLRGGGLSLAQILIGLLRFHFMCGEILWGVYVCSQGGVSLTVVI